MKKVVMFSVSFFFILANTSLDANAFKFWFSWGRYSSTSTTTENGGTTTTTETKECKGAGICGGGGKKVALLTKDTPGYASADISIVKAKMVVTMLNNKAQKDKVFEIQEDFLLDESTSKILGYASVKIKKGIYKIDFSRNKMGVIILPVDFQ